MKTKIKVSVMVSGNLVGIGTIELSPVFNFGDLQSKICKLSKVNFNPCDIYLEQIREPEMNYATKTNDIEFYDEISNEFGWIEKMQNQEEKI